MLCSVPTPKSGPNWLDRLRSTKGFPAADNSSLDHFLTNHDDPVSNPPPEIPSYSVINSNSDSTQSASDRSQATTETGGDREWYGVMTNVLCDLFNMGGGDPNPNEKTISRFFGKKSTRKQTNPKFCDVSMPCAANDTESVRKDEYVSDKNSNADCGEEEEEKEKSSGGNGGGDNESGGDKEELKGYSRSEVTVIDTSFEVWKKDKLVFRRKNVWKIVDKKGKSWNVGGTTKKKKRKGTHLDSAIGNVMNCKKKSKSTNSSIFVLPVNDGIKQQDQKQEEVCKNSLDDNFQVPKKRIDFSRSPKKAKKNGSSVVLIKAIASSKKSRKNLPNNSHLKETSKRVRLD